MGAGAPLEAQLAIGVVFHHQQIVAHQALGQGFPVGAAVGNLGFWKLGTP
jgi:hypothetical protein